MVGYAKRSLRNDAGTASTSSASVSLLGGQEGKISIVGRFQIVICPHGPCARANAVEEDAPGSAQTPDVCCSFTPRVSAIRLSSGSDRAFIFRIRLARCTLTVDSAMPISLAICLFRRPATT